MFQSIWEDIKIAFRQGNMVIRLLLANIAVFVVMALLPIFLIPIFGIESHVIEDLRKFLAINADWWYDLTHPWVIITHMFVHAGFWHLFWNMVLLYWFGRILGDLLGDRHILPIYLLGGIFGAFIYFLSANLLPETYMVGSYAFGASAAVMAIVAAAGITAPDYLLHLILLGPVRLKYIVAVLILMDLIGFGSLGGNTGGNLAHLGGAFFGFFYINQLRTTGTDLSLPVNRFLDKIAGWFRPTAKIRSMNTTQHAPKRKKRKKTDDHITHQEQLDAILDKIKVKGYESLSSEEKEFLFNASKN